MSAVECNNKRQLSISLYLLNRKGFEVLQSICNKNSSLGFIKAVVSARDKGNKEDCYEDILKLCRQHALNFYNRTEALPSNSDYSIAIGWRWLIYNCNRLIVLHDSLLPKYRGFSPLVNMLINGEKKIGVTAIFASDRMDEGEIIDQQSVAVKYPLKIQDAIEMITPLYIDLVSAIINKIVQQEEISSCPQEHSTATYSIWRNENDYFINWNNTAVEVQRFVDAVGYPYGGARTKISNETQVTILECTIVPEIISEIPGPGKVLMFDNNKPVVLCGKGAVRLDKCQDSYGNEYQFTKLRISLK